MTSVVATAMVLTVMVAAQAAAQSWLDRPLSNWNTPGRAMPRPASNSETIAALAKRCAMPMLRSTPGERAVADAGWLPFHMFERQIVDRDVEIVGGMSSADGMCRPADFNVFVFVGGRLAGSLSPAVMISRTDGSIGGGLRLAPDDTITAQFARYADADALCCPSSRVAVRYRIDRSVTPPVVVPVSVQPARQ